MIEVLKYIGNIFVSPDKINNNKANNKKPINVPYLIFNSKVYYEVKEYFKADYNINVDFAFLDSTDDKGVVLNICTSEKLDVNYIDFICNSARVGIYVACDEETPFGKSYLMIELPIKQEMENV